MIWIAGEGGWPTRSCKGLSSHELDTSRFRLRSEPWFFCLPIMFGVPAKMHSNFPDHNTKSHRPNSLFKDGKSHH